MPIFEVMTGETQPDRRERIPDGPQFVRLADPVVIHIGPQQQPLEEWMTVVDERPPVAKRLGREADEGIRAVVRPRARAVAEKFRTARDASVAITIEREKRHVGAAFRPRDELRCAIVIDVKADALFRRGEGIGALGVGRQHERAVPEPGLVSFGPPVIRERLRGCARRRPLLVCRGGPRGRNGIRGSPARAKGIVDSLLKEQNRQNNGCYERKAAHRRLDF
jgi:hypothetical protein